jgi:predicted RNase H-like nuclease (RuvC/YqgF family)
MDIDERLAALTQTVELLASFHRDGEKRMERLDQHMERLDQHMERLGQHMEQFAQATKGLAKRNDRLENLVTDIAEGTARLLHVAEVREQRIGDLEGNQAQQ